MNKVPPERRELLLRLANRQLSLQGEARGFLSELMRVTGCTEEQAKEFKDFVKLHLGYGRIGNIVRFNTASWKKEKAQAR